MPTLRLIFKENTNVLLVKPKDIIGRNKMLVTHVLMEVKVSRQHCQFDWRNGKWWVIDLGSLNGTFLNHEKIPEPSYLLDGDQIRIGDTIFIVDTTYGEAE